MIPRIPNWTVEPLQRFRRTLLINLNTERQPNLCLQPTGMFSMSPQRVGNDGFISAEAIAQLATREFIAKSINEIGEDLRKYRKEIDNQTTTADELGRSFFHDGFIGAGGLLFSTSGPFENPVDVDCLPILMPILRDGDDSPVANLTREPGVFHVGIFGAGMAGLYTAMILESLGITYEIMEASDRIGGRVYTHRFSEGRGDYYDVGAMRFPETPVMKRTFHLFEILGIQKRPSEPGTAHEEEGTLIPYYMTSPNTPSYFNGIVRHPGSERAAKGTGLESDEYNNKTNQQQVSN